MFYKIVKKDYDTEAGVYYYKTMADINPIDIKNISHIIKLPCNCILLACNPLNDSYVFSKYNHSYSEFDETLEVK